MDPLGLLCGLVLFACLWVAGPILLIGGGAGTLFAGRGEDGRSRVIPIIMLALGIAWTVTITLRMIPEKDRAFLLPSYHIGDKELEQYQTAINTIDRETLGLSPITKDVPIKILTDQRASSLCRDIELYIADLPVKEHSICLERRTIWYYWQSEYEIYKGPEESQSLWLIARRIDPEGPGGSVQRPSAVIIEYRGPRDPRLPDEPLTLENIQPMLAAWRDYHLGH